MKPPPGRLWPCKNSEIETTSTMGTVTRAVVCMIVVVTASHPVGNRFFVALSHGRLTAGPHRHEHEDSDRGDRDDQQLTQCVERPEIHEDDVDDVRAATTWNCLPV